MPKIIKNIYRRITTGRFQGWSNKKNQKKWEKMKIVWKQVKNRKLFPKNHFFLSKIRQAWANDHLRISPLCNNNHFGVPFSLYITQSYLWTTITSHQQQIQGPKGGCCTQVWLYLLLLQAWLLHLNVSVEFPLQGRSPFASAGLPQTLERVWVPPPQVFEQTVKDDHSPHPPSNLIKSNRLSN